MICFWSERSCLGDCFCSQLICFCLFFLCNICSFCLEMICICAKRITSCLFGKRYVPVHFYLFGVCSIGSEIIVTCSKFLSRVWKWSVCVRSSGVPMGKIRTYFGSSRSSLCVDHHHCLSHAVSLRLSVACPLCSSSSFYLIVNFLDKDYSSSGSSPFAAAAASSCSPSSRCSCHQGRLPPH